MLDHNKQVNLMTYDPLPRPNSIQMQAKLMSYDPQPHEMSLNGSLQQVGEATSCLFVCLKGTFLKAVL
jgi:hypothetical protein